MISLQKLRLAAISTLAMLVAMSAARADEISQLQAQTPTRAEQQGVMNDQYVTKGVFPGSFMIPGTTTSLHVGGFINFQVICDPTQNLGPKFSIGNLIPNCPAPREFRLNAQSKSAIRFRSPKV
ncbi:MAG: hypothetical protein B7Z78_02700 [Rhodospirillales bacterium 20-60-12]|nr:MAG: hypothetical protein B7Z78_02700 [Rhodospirillales bacterium 20-60-12]